MSTIVSPREASVNGRRIPPISTPTSSSRPSLENPRSLEGSPNRASSIHAPPKRNRAALREYYNIQKAASPLNDESSSASSVLDNAQSDVLESELDRENFNGEEYVRHVLETQSLEELLRTYNGVLTNIRALDAEKKALVYDNYSKLIAATETIRKMRNNMDPLNPMASTLDPAIRSVYERAENIKQEMRKGMPEWQRQGKESGDEERKKLGEKRRIRGIVISVLETPEKLRELMREGREQEAAGRWNSTLLLLERWKERGVGGNDVQDCIEDGEAALRGEPPTDKSWAYLKATRESKS